MTEPLTLSKLIVLYMLNQVDFALTKAQIFDFILEKDYSDYFTLQQATFELTESKFIESTSTHSQTLLKITPEGKDTLKFFANRLSEGLKRDINDYLTESRMQIYNELSVITNYYKTSNGDYIADLSAREKTSDLINIKINMPTEEAAEAVCDHWKQQSQDIYSFLLEKLL